MSIQTNTNNIPDVRDGLTTEQRLVLYCMHLCMNQSQKERAGRSVSTAMLYGLVREYIDISEEQLQLILQGLARFKNDAKV